VRDIGDLSHHHLVRQLRDSAVDAMECVRQSQRRVAESVDILNGASRSRRDLLRRIATGRFYEGCAEQSDDHGVAAEQAIADARRTTYQRAADD